MTDETPHVPPSEQSATTPVNGVNIKARKVGVQGDVVGRDRITYRIKNIFRGTEEIATERQRQQMLQLMENTWINGVFKKSLYKEVMLELGMEERADAVERPWDMVLQEYEQPNRPVPAGTRILQVFDEQNHALLILGSPGAGKTTTLLELASDAIARAKGDPTQPIPIVFTLSSWARERKPLAEWLSTELNVRYYVPPKVAKAWVEQDALLVLLDGLDEVKLEARDACVEAINEYRHKHGLTQIAVCSRIADYEALSIRLKLQGAVLLQPLTRPQITQYFKDIGEDLAGVCAVLEHDAVLQDMTH